ncbi:hypothetical protein EVAR_86152_1 [Eumeta japonica]|uniref:Uncharacterized protein n=1 Tax=Eumeta variegata TaxID=151549 RepID=A0A4C1YYA4_EUMVA|nr:hypothetical protein EVAR_86152_1 [Eumeta japonica]
MEHSSFYHSTPRPSTLSSLHQRYYPYPRGRQRTDDCSGVASVHDYTGYLRDDRILPDGKPTAGFKAAHAGATQMKGFGRTGERVYCDFNSGLIAGEEYGERRRARRAQCRHVN